MISIRPIPTKILLVLFMILFTPNLQSTSRHLTAPYYKHTTIHHSINRKFNTAAFFQGLANTCAHAGTVAAAQTQQEKQQAACNVLASVFQTAAALSEKSKKRVLSSDDMVTTTIKSTIEFLNTMTPEEKGLLLSPNYAYLQAITTLQTEKEQTKFITQTLARKDEGIAFLNELFSLFKTIVSDQLPGIFDALQLDVLKDLNLN